MSKHFVIGKLFIDTIYTERYMNLPQENPAGYQRSDLLALAPKLRGRKYLLVHGTGDDNVHYQHSLQLAKVLQHADIPFEQMVCLWKSFMGWNDS